MYKKTISKSDSKLENTLAFLILTIFMGQVYIHTPISGFRLSLAVVFLSLFLIYFREFKPARLCLAVGVMMCFFRSLISYLAGDMGSFADLLILYFPVVGFYLSFGMLFGRFNIRSKLTSPASFIMNLWVCDSLSNTAESLIRKAWLKTDFGNIFMSLLVIGLLRSLMTYAVYWFGNRKVDRVKSTEKEKYFKELVLFTSKLKTELFFLKKSRGEMEETVSMIHDCYKNVQDKSLRPGLLKIAKDIHEIKKDYYRVIAGMETTLSIDSQPARMSFEEILDLIRDTMEKLSLSQGKDISIDTSFDFLMDSKSYYELISIVNNLVTNSIESIESSGKISISFAVKDGQVVISVSDDGCGMEDDQLDTVFEPGYSTKYDRTSGKMSTGIGLSHVKNIVEDHFHGRIELESGLNQGSTFHIYIPIDNI